MSRIRNFIIKHFGGLPSKDSWKWLIRVNPESPNSFPLANEYRKVAPGSQPDPKPNSIHTPSKISKNKYFERDLRRKFPQTIVHTAQVNIEGMPPVIKNRYQYTQTNTHDPTGSEANPEYSIRMVK